MTLMKTISVVIKAQINTPSNNVSLGYIKHAIQCYIMQFYKWARHTDEAKQGG